MRRLIYLKVSLIKIIYRLVVPMLYSDKQERKKHLKQWTTKSEKKYLTRYLNVLDAESNEKEGEECPKIIWIRWLQGMNKAPEIVKKCYQSIQKWCPEYEIKLIDNENISSYVSMPKYIIDKYQKGYISNTHFSDLLRLALLDEHGGYWIDATVYLTAPIPEKIQKSPFFAYHSEGYLHNNNWFLKSNKGNQIIYNIKRLLYEYWKQEKRVINYFIYHIFFDLMIESNTKLAEEWRKVPVLYDDCYELEHSFFKPYEKEKWLEINQKTHIHKLSYKYDKNKNIQGSFLEYLLNDKLD